MLFNALGCLKILSECFINLEAFYKYLRLPESQSTGHKKNPPLGGFFCIAALAFAGGQFFFDAGGLAGEAAQVVQFGTAYVTTAFYFDFFNCG